MKRVRILLSAIAFVLAISGAAASLAIGTTEIGYEFIDNPDPIPDVCDKTDTPCDGGLYACKVTPTSPTLRHQNSSTVCGSELSRSTP